MSVDTAIVLRKTLTYPKTNIVIISDLLQYVLLIRCFVILKILGM